MGFTTDVNAAGIRTQGFHLRGLYLYVYRDDIKGLGIGFRAYPTETPGIWSLTWNVTTPMVGEGSIFITLRNI
jgi:hypothetical protein